MLDYSPLSYETLTTPSSPGQAEDLLSSASRRSFSKVAYLPTYLIVNVRLSLLKVFPPSKHDETNCIEEREGGKGNSSYKRYPLLYTLSNSNNDNDNDNDGDDKATHSTRPGLLWSALVHSDRSNPFQ